MDGVLILLEKGENRNIYNISTTDEITIKKLISLLEKITGTKIKIQITTQPIGSTNRRCPDIKKIRKLGFMPKINIEQGLLKTYGWYERHYDKIS